MKSKKIKIFHIIGAISVILFGALLHFVYEWSGGNRIVGIFGAINESTWEHLKLFLWPVIVFNIIEYFAYGKNIKNFIPIKVQSILLGLIAIPTLFYTYSGIIGQNFIVLDILTFVFAVIIAFVYSYKKLKSNQKVYSKCSEIFYTIILMIVVILFVVFTFVQPHIGLFYDYSEGLYGFSIPK